MSSSPFGGLLCLDEVTEFAREDNLGKFWGNILEIFIASQSQSFCVSDVRSVQDLTRIACFKDWQPKRTKRTTIRLEWDVPARGHKWHDLTLTRLDLNAEVIHRLRRAEFQDWFASSDDYPADHLYFFAGDQLLIDAEPNELAIMFYNLTSARRQSLDAIAPEAARALDFSRNWTATTLSVLDAP